MIFWVLRDAKVLNPTSKITYADLNVGIPNIITCLIMVPHSGFFHYAYSVKPYVISPVASSETYSFLQPTKMYQGGIMSIKAWARALNPLETLQAIIFGFKVQ
jgi:subtilase family serine protease